MEDISKKIKKIIKETTTKPVHLDKLMGLYEKYVYRRDMISPIDFLDDREVQEFGVSYNQVCYWLFDDNLIEILETELRPQTHEVQELIEELADEWYESGTKQEI